MNRVCADRNTMNQINNFLDCFLTGGKHLVFCIQFIAAGIDLIMVDVNYLFPGNDLPQFHFF